MENSTTKLPYSDAEIVQEFLNGNNILAVSLWSKRRIEEVERLIRERLRATEQSFDGRHLIYYRYGKFDWACTACDFTGDSIEAAHHAEDKACEAEQAPKQALQEPLYRRDFERAVSKEIETYGAPSGCDEAIAFSDGAEWALAHFSNIIISERDPQ